MSTLNDIVEILPTDAMQTSAIDYAGRSINYTYDRMGYSGRIQSRLIRIVVGLINEQVIQAYLDEHHVVYGLTGRTHWRLKDKAEFIVGGRPVDIKGYHVYPAAGRQFPSWFLETETMVPVDQLRRAPANEVYLQVFLVAPQVNRSNAHQFIAIFPIQHSQRWRGPSRVDVEIKQTRAGDITLDLFGENGLACGQAEHVSHDYFESMVCRGDQGTISSVGEFSSLQYARLNQKPQNDIVIRHGAGQEHTIRSEDWCDLFLDTPSVYLAGWANHHDFVNGTVIPVGTRTRVYTMGTRTPNRSLLVSQLQPISSLL